MSPPVAVSRGKKIVSPETELIEQSKERERQREVTIFRRVSILEVEVLQLNFAFSKSYLL